MTHPTMVNHSCEIMHSRCLTPCVPLPVLCVLFFIYGRNNNLIGLLFVACVVVVSAAGVDGVAATDVGGGIIDADGLKGASN